MCLDVVDQMFKCAGNYFLLGALITPVNQEAHDLTSLH